jgi:hypothetical protein
MIIAWGKILQRIIAWGFLLFGLLVVDACYYRDPFVDLSHGYSVSASSPGSPAVLVYYPSEDPRPYSQLQAFRSLERTRGPDGKRTVLERYCIINTDNYEGEDFETYDEWQQAIRDRNARPPAGLLLENISNLRREKDLCYGAMSEGWFLLRIPDNQLITFDDREEWMRNVHRVTGGAPKPLLPPTHLSLQSRPISYLVGIAAVLAFFLLLQIIEIVKSLKTKRYQPTGPSEPGPA